MNFVDEVKIKVRSGDGGNGMLAWRREKYEPLGGPAGGTGGRGGHVIFEASNDLSTLLDFRYKSEFHAEPGQKGGPKNRHGKSGQDLILKVPVGTVIKDLEDERIIADLSVEGARALVAEGGRGGRGNAELASPTLRAPYFCEPGESGIERQLELTLKLLADIGLVGLPNAGKSTLLSVLTAAKPKIADYPFSTLSPNLGVMRGAENDGYVLADIPGLIEGASKGVGLGHTFLRHIERTRVLIHLVDINSENIRESIKIIMTELASYEPRLLSMPQILFLNKADLMPAEQSRSITEQLQNEKEKIFAQSQAVFKIIAGSTASQQGIDELKKSIFELMAKTPRQEQIFQVLEDEKAYQHPDEGFITRRKKDCFFVSGERIEKILSVTNLKSPESLQHFFHVLRAMGVMEQLLSDGLNPGDEIVIGKTSFIYGDDMA